MLPLSSPRPMCVSITLARTNNVVKLAHLPTMDVCYLAYVIHAFAKTICVSLPFENYPGLPIRT